jgi:hypothetical protein
MRTLILVLAGAAAFVSAQQNPFLGRWNMTGTGSDSSYVYWLEVKEEAGVLTGMFLNRTGNPVALAAVKIENDELVFHMAGRGGQLGQEFRARLENGRLIGRHTLTQGGRGRRGGGDPNTPPPAPTQRVVNWVGVRPPAWPAADANATHSYGAPVALFDGTSLDAFTVQHVDRPIRWSVEDGLATNEKGANNLVLKERFKDFKIEAEYRLSQGSNSGIYLRGRYELQLLDDATQQGGRADLGHMAIYGRKAPLVKASKPAGEWQTMSAVVVANRVTVVLNGQRVHDNQVIEGITGGALDNDELAPGPIMIQGDHSQVWLRRVVVTPIK